MRKLTTEEVIKRCKELYGDMYDYSKIEYVNIDTKITVICPKHGEFHIRPDHFFEGNGCPKCGNERGGNKNRMTIEEFFKRAKEVHGDRYDYSKAEYTDARTKVCIICPEHGEFWQTPDAHLRGAKCPKCVHRSYKYTTDEFIQLAKEIHGDKYDYSKVNYVDRLTPVCIVCPEHGVFWQKPREHFKGKGCPLCHESVLERDIETLLKNNGIAFETQKRFNWLRNKWPMPLDFYLPEYKVAIECQGEQHFGKIEFFSRYNFEERLELDLLKKKLCEENGIRILYYSKKYIVPEYWNKYNVIYNKKKLIDEIKEN
jgi:hypothetical protein